MKLSSSLALYVHSLQEGAEVDTWLLGLAESFRINEESCISGGPHWGVPLYTHESYRLIFLYHTYCRVLLSEQELFFIFLTLYAYVENGWTISRSLKGECWLCGGLDDCIIGPLSCRKEYALKLCKSVNKPCRGDLTKLTYCTIIIFCIINNFLLYYLLLGPSLFFELQTWRRSFLGDLLFLCSCK